MSNNAETPRSTPRSTRRKINETGNPDDEMHDPTRDDDDDDDLEDPHSLIAELRSAVFKSLEEGFTTASTKIAKLDKKHTDKDTATNKRIDILESSTDKRVTDLEAQLKTLIDAQGKLATDHADSIAEARTLISKVEAHTDSLATDQAAARSDINKVEAAVALPPSSSTLFPASTSTSSGILDLDKFAKNIIRANCTKHVAKSAMARLLDARAADADINDKQYQLQGPQLGTKFSMVFSNSETGHRHAAKLLQIMRDDKDDNGNFKEYFIERPDKDDDDKPILERIYIALDKPKRWVIAETSSKILKDIISKGCNEDPKNVKYVKRDNLILINWELVVTLKVNDDSSIKITWNDTNAARYILDTNRLEQNFNTAVAARATTRRNRV